jgi:hypothetical protein
MNNTGETTGRMFKMCTEISDICTVERTVLGYYPNFGANAFFAAAFLLIAVASGGIGVWKRTWTFTVTVTGGTALEGVGKFHASHHHPPRDKNTDLPLPQDTSAA